MTPKGTYIAAAFSAFFLFVLSPAALAQGLPDPGDTTGGVTDTAGDTTGGVTDTVGDTAGGTTDTVGDTTGGVTDTVGGVTGGSGSGTGTGDVGETVGGVTDTVDGTAGGNDDSGGGSAGSGDLAGTVTNTVDNTGGGLTGGGSDGGGSHGSTVDELLSGDPGVKTSGIDGLAPGGIDEIVDEASTLGLSPAAAQGWIEGSKILASASFATPRAALGSFADLVQSIVSTVATSSSTASRAVSLSVEKPDGESFFQAAGRAATEAAKTLAFPLALALLVVGFLTVQGRIGREDPKLTLAPVDTSQETLSFE